MEMGAFVNAFLVIDHAKTTVGVIEGFAPAKIGPDGEHIETPGSKTGPSYKFAQGRCVFYTGTGCLIYEARPFECTHYVCTKMPEDNPSRLQLALLWLDAHNDESKDAGPENTD
jgi:Fe-S-cluster containining protein